MHLSPEVAERKIKLEEMRLELKRDFFGIDPQIDKIIDSIKTWYIMPELFDRPLIINLWGLTGVGKTSLVRQLVNGLGFSDRFLEMQMGGFENNSNNYHSKNSVFSMLKKSKIKEGCPGIILFDEFQRFRTIDEKGMTIASPQYQDIWQLLSDGYCSKDYTMYKILDEFLDDREKINATTTKTTKIFSYDGNGNLIEEATNNTSENDNNQKSEVALDRWDAKYLCDLLDRKYKVSELMTFSKDQLSDIITDYLNTAKAQLDYTKCLCIISGNLDEAFSISSAVDDSDTDADYFFQYTKNISMFKIKTALTRRFKPEQIARLGNNNIIYPSLSKLAYKNIIQKECNNIMNRSKDLSNISFTIDDGLIKIIYDNSVFPTQGTRPVFSSIHQLFGSQMAEAMLWGIENKIENICVSINEMANKIVYSSIGPDAMQIEFDVNLEIKKRKEKYTKSTKTLIAVHEAGHALVYSLLKKMAPYEIKINTASWTGGYNLLQDSNIIRDKSSWTIDISVLLAGKVAEELVFGPDNVSAGCANDIQNATKLAAEYIRDLGFSGSIGRIDLDTGSRFYIRSMDSSDIKIEELLQTCYKSTRTLLRDNMKYLLEISKLLVDGGELTKSEYSEYLKNNLDLDMITNDPDKLNCLIDYDAIFTNKLNS